MGYVAWIEVSGGGEPEVEQVSPLLAMEDEPRGLRGVPDGGSADESVLALHELALVNPRTIKFATNRRVRTKLPATIELIHRVTTDAVEVVDGLATMPLKDALLARRGRVMRERLVEATHTALAQELIDEDDAAEVLQRLKPVST